MVGKKENLSDSRIQFIKRTRTNLCIQESQEDVLNKVTRETDNTDEIDDMMIQHFCAVSERLLLILHA